MSYSVAERRLEIGIRMAMCAEAGTVLGMVLRYGLLVAGAGLVLGIGGAVLLTRLMSSFVYGIETTDAVTFVIAPTVLSLVALAACYVPARRATRVDPVAVLKEE
jgi:ABC-type antimicrobial peptide transport system permease subunit